MQLQNHHCYRRYTNNPSCFIISNTRGERSKRAGIVKFSKNKHPHSNRTIYSALLFGVEQATIFSFPSCPLHIRISTLRIISWSAFHPRNDKTSPERCMKCLATGRHYHLSLSCAVGGMRVVKKPESDNPKYSLLPSLTSLRPLLTLPKKIYTSFRVKSDCLELPATEGM